MSLLSVASGLKLEHKHRVWLLVCQLFSSDEAAAGASAIPATILINELLVLYNMSRI